MASVFRKFSMDARYSSKRKKFKKWKLQWKIYLIEKGNPEWLDLAESLWDVKNYEWRWYKQILRRAWKVSRIECGKYPMSSV
jgi:hypothetical protein